MREHMITLCKLMPERVSKKSVTRTDIAGRLRRTCTSCTVSDSQCLHQT